MKIRALLMLSLLGMFTASQAGELQWGKPNRNIGSDAVQAGASFPIVQVQHLDEIIVAERMLAPVPAEIQPAETETVIKAVKKPCTLELKPITSISYDIRPKASELPDECILNSGVYEGRNFNTTCYQWKASNLCTKGAYFEDVQAERYGHSVCPTLQPVISGAKFFAKLPLLPYYMGVNPPNECVYTLGHYRVGNCSPYMIQPFPLSLRGALFEGAVVGGVVAALP